MHDLVNNEQTLNQAIDRLNGSHRLHRQQQLISDIGRSTGHWVQTVSLRRHIVAGMCVLAILFFSTPTLISSQLPDEQMNVVMPFSRQHANLLASDIICHL